MEKSSRCKQPSSLPMLFNWQELGWICVFIVVILFVDISHAQQPQQPQRQIQLTEADKASLQAAAQQIEVCTKAGTNAVRAKCHKGIVASGPPKRLIPPSDCAQIYGVSLKLRCHDRVVKKLPAKLSFIWNHTYGKMIANTRKEIAAARLQLGLGSDQWLREFDDGQRDSLEKQKNIVPKDDARWKKERSNQP